MNIALLMTAFLFLGSLTAQADETSTTEVKIISEASFKSGWNEEQTKEFNTLTIAYRGGCTMRTAFKLSILSKEKTEHGSFARVGVRVFEVASTCRMAKFNVETVDLNQLLREQIPASDKLDGVTFEVIPKVTYELLN